MLRWRKKREKRREACCKLRPVSIGVSCTLNMLMWCYINEERDDKSFMGVERVSSCVGNCVMKHPLRMAL